MKHMRIRPGLIDEIARQILPNDVRGNKIPVDRSDTYSNEMHINDVVLVLLMPHIDTVVDLLIETRNRGILPFVGETKDDRGCTARWAFETPPTLATMVGWFPGPGDESLTEATP